MNEKKIKDNFLNKEKYLSCYATKSSDAIRLKKEKEDIRPPYFHDIDRIIHALSYSRYMDKTQVFSECENDHISRRMVHVQLVSKTARTIGRALNLNEDLIEAIALSHDIGHTPLGHSGEAMLDEICKSELNTSFAHNIQGVHYYIGLTNTNLTIQVLDGIMCHNGELVSEVYKPVKKTKEEFLKEFNEAFVDVKKSLKYHPMTLEGCVVRISDVIGYIGRDIEDAIILGKIKREDIPKEITDILGSTNREIMNTIILDIINNSLDKPYIKMSEEVYKALFMLKDFNYNHIYKYSLTKDEYDRYSKGMKDIYHRYLLDIENDNIDSLIYKDFLAHQSPNYLTNTSNKQKVIDFIAGMTDDYFVEQIS